MGQPHKWAKEIKAWADGADIEAKWWKDKSWFVDDNPDWNEEHIEYRIKPQPTKEEIEKELARQLAEKALAIPEISEAVDRLFEAFAEKEPQYLYVYKVNGKIHLIECGGYIAHNKDDYYEYIGKIKLEQDDE